MRNKDLTQAINELSECEADHLASAARDIIEWLSPNPGFPDQSFHDLFMLQIDLRQRSQGKEV